jgi:nitrogen regulatory protein PII
MYMAKETKANKSQIGLKAMFLIVDWDRLKVITEVFAKENCALCYVTKGLGTANSEILDVLGIGATPKAVFLCFMESSALERLINAIRHAMGPRNIGAGIAFTVLLSGTSANIIKMFETMKAEDDAATGALGAARAPGAQTTKKESFMASFLSREPKESKNSKVSNDSKGSIEIKNDMIISILNAGYSDAFMAEARKAGARGGTVLNARGLSAELAKKFLGISVQAEKEIVLILAQNDVKVPIMQAISAGFGTATKAAGLIFSLPVEKVMSLNELS